MHYYPLDIFIFKFIHVKSDSEVVWACREALTDVLSFKRD